MAQGKTLVIENKYIESDKVQVNKLKEQLIAQAQQADELREKLSEAREEASSLRSELDDLKSENGFDELNKKAEQFRQLVYSTTLDLKGYLRSVGLDAEMWRFQEFFDGFKDGSMTFRRAVAEISNSEKELIAANREAFGELSQSGDIKAFSETLDKISSALDVVLEKITTIERDGVKAVNSVGSGDAGSVAESFAKIGEALTAMSYDAQAAQEPISKIVQTIREYESIDTEKILSVTQAFSGIAGAGEVSAESVSGVVELAQKIQMLSDVGSGGMISKGFVDGILPSIQHIIDGMADLGNKGAAAVDKITEKLQEMTGLLSQISQKSFSLQGIFNNGGRFKTDAQELELVKNEALELTKVIANMTAALGKIDITAATRGTTLMAPLVDALGRVKDESEYLAKIDTSTTVGNVQKVTAEMQGLYRIFNDVITRASDLGQQTPVVDTSGYEEAAKRVSEYRQKIQELQNKIIEAAAEASSSAPAASVESSAERTNALEQEKQQVNEVGTAYESHTASVKDAAEAERLKASVSREVADGLKTEGSVTEAVTASSEKHAESLFRIGTGLEEVTGGFQKIANSLTMEGVAPEFANRIAESFEDLDGQITSVEARWRDFGEAGKQVSSVTVKAMDEVGNSIQRTVSYTYPIIDGAKQIEELESGRAKIDLAAAEAARARADAEYQKQANIELARMAEEDAMREGAEAAANEAANQKKLSGAYMETGKSAKDSAEAMKMAWAVESQATKEMERAAKDSKAAAEEKYRVENAYISALSQGEDALRRYTAAENSKNAKSREAYRTLRESTEELRRAKAEYDSNGRNVDALRDATNRYNLTLKEVKRTVSETGDNVKTMGERIRDAASQFSTWFSLTRIIMSVYREIRKMISTSIELDQTMTQLRIVTKASEDEIERFGEAAAKSAKRVGASITDLTSSATVFARLGYSVSESSMLAEYTTMLKNVGDIDINDATDAVTAIVKAFKGIDVDSIEQVMDKLVTVGK